MNTTTAKIPCQHCPSRTLLVHWAQPLNVVSVVGLEQLRAPGGTTQLSAMSPSDCKPATTVQTIPPSPNTQAQFLTRKHISNYITRTARL